MVTKLQINNLYEIVGDEEELGLSLMARSSSISTKDSCLSIAVL